MNPQSHNMNQSIVEQYDSAAVIGLGATGYSAVRYLRARGLSVVVLDSRAKPDLAGELAASYPEVTTHYGDFSYANLQGVPLLIVSPGVPLSTPVLKEAKYEGAHLVGDVELFLQEWRSKLIAITGSNGKSTVTTLVGEMCRAAGLKTLVAGNIGIPVLDAITDGVDYDVAVLELSSFQLETTNSVPADSAAILNVSADHLDRYDSMGDYQLAKARILRGAKRAILPRHDEQINQVTVASEALSFDLDEPANDAEFGIKRQSNYRWLMKGSSRLMKLRDIPLTGLHNVKNTLAAFALTDFLNAPLDALVSAVKSFNGLEHRMQTIGEFNSVRFVNDSKATNVGATSTALLNLEQEIIWIAGGQGKGADFSALKNAITPNIKLLVLIGEDANQIEKALYDLLPMEHAASLPEAVKVAASAATQGSIVLLSPACASFDMFDGFEDRGNTFTHEVIKLAEKGVA